MTYENAAEELLDKLSAERHSLGREALKRAIMLCVREAEYEYEVYKLYAEIAVMLERSVSTVEREIRRCIREGWEKGGTEAFGAVLPASFGKNGKTPSNSVFIAACSEWVRLNP